MKLESIRAEFTQEADSCDELSEIFPVQQLSVETPDAGGGAYIVLSTKRWAIGPDELDDFVATLRGLLAQVGDE